MTSDTLIFEQLQKIQAGQEALGRELRSDIRKLQDGQDALTGDVRQLQEGQTALTGDVRQLHEGQAALSGDVRRLHTGQDALADEICKLQGDVGALRGDFAELRTQFVTLRTNVSDQVSDLLDAIKKRDDEFQLTATHGPRLARIEDRVKHIENHVGLNASKN